MESSSSMAREARPDRSLRVAILGVFVVSTLIFAACGGTSSLPTAPTAQSPISPLSEAGSGTTALDGAGEDSRDRLVASRQLLAVGDTNVPLVSGSYCGFSAQNPYPCCQNSASQFGNCTGWVWEAARNAGWGNGLPPGWGDAKTWRNSALAAGYLVDATPTVKSIGIANNGPTLKNHVAFVEAFDGYNVRTSNQQCGSGLTGGVYRDSRAYTNFNDGYVRAPIPTANVFVWSGAASAGNGGTLTVTRPLFGSGVTVSFGFSLLRANINTSVKGASRFVWTLSGMQVSTEGTFSKTFTTAGTYPVSVRVTNGMNVTTMTTATVVVR